MGFIEPCFPTLVHGYRFICRRDGDRVRVFSQRGNDYTGMERRQPASPRRARTSQRCVASDKLQH
jgi:ATP-dependent DNA ligase